MKYKHILIAIDLLDGSSKLIKRAMEIAKEFGSKVSLIHVVEPLPGYGYAFISPAEIETQLVDEAKKQVQKIGAKYDIPEDQQYVEMGPTKIEIIDIADDHHVDLIAVGTHTRHGLAHLLGSTANAVVHGANCDVLTVRVD
jgi:universal stress protein A